MAALRARRLLIALAMGALPALAVGPARAAAPPRVGDACPPEACATVTGVVRLSGRRTPLADASVLVVPALDGDRPGRSRTVRESEGPGPEPAWVLAARTDDDGRFVVEGVPRGRVRLVVIAAGALRTRRVVSVVDEGVDTTVFVDPDPDSPYRTVVTAERAPDPAPRRHVLERHELRTMPGTQGDPLRGLQNLPGVARPPAGLGLLVLRGAAPAQSAVYLGGHRIPRAFHVLSLSSVFPTDVIERLDFVPGNFDATYGNATGGLVIVEPRAGRRDGFHGYGELDLAGISALAEGPVGDGSYIVGAQRGYIDAVVAGAGAVIEQVTGEPSDLLLPSYWDYQAQVDQPLPGGASFTLRALGAGDRLRGAGLLDSQGFDFRSDFHRVDAVFRKQHPRWSVLLTPSVRYQLGRIELSNDTLQRRRDDVIPSLRAQGTRRIAPGFELTLGTDFEVSAFFTRDRSAVIDPGSLELTSQRQTARDRGVMSTIGTFASAQLSRGRVTVIPGVRVSGYTVEEQAVVSVDPRVSMRWTPGERWSVTAGVGRYSQARSVSDTDAVDLVEQGTGLTGASVFLPPVFSRFDPSVELGPRDTQLTARQALQVSAGAERDLGSGWSIGATGFGRDQEDAQPVIFDGAPFPVGTRSRVLGLELLLRKRLTKRLYGWIAYTLSWGQLRFVQAPPGNLPDPRPSDFDQRHNLVALASYVLPRGWRLGGRFRFVTGYPYTPVLGSIAVRGGFVPVRGPRNSARLPAFHQLDIRVDRAWVLARAELSAFFELQNLYNRVNPEAVLYSADFRREVGFVGVPIFPSLGLRVDW